MGALALLGGMALVLGVLLVSSGWRRRPPPPPRRRRVVALPLDRLALAGGVGLLAVILTRWPVAAGGVAAAAWFASGWWRQRTEVSPEQKAEALALWVEMLRDTVGTARGLEGVIAVTAGTAPPLIRADVTRVASRLQQNVPLDRVLQEMAIALDHPVSDLVVVALRNASRAGGGKLGEVLDDLATAAHGEADVHRRLEVARARPRASMRYIAIAIAATLIVLAIFADNYLSPYRTTQGQVFLALVGALVVLAFSWMQRLGRIGTIDRLLRPQP
jgi:Flp pilus assembly protein TadB